MIINPLIYQHFFEDSLDAMIIGNAQGKIVKANTAFFYSTGYQLEETLNNKITFSISTRHNADLFFIAWAELQNNQHWEGEIWNKRANGKDFLCLQKVSVVRDESNRLLYFMITINDIFKLKKSEKQFWYLAHYDTLTGLVNRRFLEQRLTEEISAAYRSKSFGALLFFDLDNFKKINDSLGHKMGDQVLVEISKMIQVHLRKEDVFCRLGGDEFVILFYRLSNQLEVAAKIVGSIIQKIINTIREPLLIDDYSFFITASFGVTFFPLFADSAENALKQADIAMYSAKNKGKNTYSFYHPIMQKEADKRLTFETELRNSIRLNHLYLVYQPQYNYTKEILGYEVLVRWNHPEKGFIPPSDFIPMAEESGLIVELGKKILLDACTQLVNWTREGKNIPKLSINVSPLQFHHDGFVEMMIDILTLTGADPKKITLEITENVIVHDVNSVTNKMYQLKKLGISFSIDDFGTGYSSLAYLRQMPIDELKIDRSFIKDMLNRSSDATIVSTIIGMAQQLNLNLIAEGVEETEQICFLFKNGCDGFQGFCLSFPLEHHEVDIS